MQKRLVAFGTSLTSTGGWVKMLSKKLPDWKVINSGKGGENSGWGIWNIERKVLKYNPHVVLMEFAVNDAYIRDNFCGKTELEQSLQNIFDMIKQLKWSKVYYMTMNPPFDEFISGRNPAADRPGWRLYYKKHREVAYKAGATIINITARWEALDRDGFLAYCPDGLHPNELGSEKITVPTILEALQ